MNLSRQKNPPPYSINSRKQRGTLSQQGRWQYGFSLMEVLVVMAVLGILYGLIATGYKGMNHEAQTASSILKAAILQARTEAISTSSVVRVKVTYPSTVVFETHSSCNQTSGWTTLPRINAVLPTGVVLSGAANWAICFKSRGDLEAPAASTLTITDAQGRQKVLTMYMTGSVNVP